jgi:5-formyltetrahydrofolate cyclo-ligase
MNKNELRKSIRSLKAAHTDAQLAQQSDTICKSIMEDDLFKKSEVVFVYWALKDEVDTLNLIEEVFTNKTILLPVVVGSELELRVFKGKEQMKQVPPYGIYEPQTEVFTEYDKIDLALIPGMAFDKQNNRLGRGKAFYDGLLPALACPKYGLCFDFQLVDEIPVESHDIPMDKVFSS